MQSIFSNRKTSDGAGNISYQRGFMQIIVLAIVVIAGLAYFNIDVHGFFQNPGIQKVVVILTGAWTNYLAPLFIFLWTSVANLFGF